MDPVLQYETLKTSFYSALRSNDANCLSNLLETTEIESANLVSLLSETYEEVKLKNIPISEDIQSMTEYKLLDLQFISEIPNKTFEDFRTSFTEIKDHLNFVCAIIKLFLQSNFVIDTEFVYHCRYITQHLSVLKRRLEYSYDTIPWEEMQFCLAMYVHILIKPENSDNIYKLILKKGKIVSYLKYFYEELEKINKQITENDLKRERSFNRNHLKECVLKKSPKFEDLYADFTLLRDIYSLDKINNYIAKALRVSFKENANIGQLVIERTLQVMGEYIKNTPDSPNLSDNLYKMLLKSAPRNLKTVLANLRNMLSHTLSLTRKLELENSKHPDFFEKVQTDLRKIQIDIIYFLYKQKIAAIKMFLRSFLDMEDVKDFRIILNESNIEAIKEITDYSINLEEFLKVKGLIDLFCNKILEESCDYFEEIEDIQNSFKSYESKVINVSSSYAEVIKKVCQLITIDKDLNVIKNMVRTYLSLLSNSEPENLYKDVYLKILHIHDDLQIKKDFNTENILNPDEKIVKINNIIIEIQGYIKVRLRRIKWIEEMEDDLSFKENEINEKYSKAEEIFEMVLNKLETIEDKNVVRTAIEIVQKRHSLKNELKIDSFINMKNDEFTSKLLFLNLSAKRQKEILYNFEKKKTDKLKLMIKEIDDNYGAFLNKLGDIFPLVKYLNPIKAFYESFKFKNALRKKIDKAIDEAINEKIINCYKERLDRLKTILINVQNTKNDDLIMVSLEMLVLDLMEFLENVKLLSDNKFLSVKPSSILMGKQLRNFLAHGDILTDLSFYNNNISVMFHAEKLVQATENILNRKNILVGYKANDADFSFQSYNQRCQNVIRIQTKLFDLAKNYCFEELEQIIENGADMFGRSFENWNILNFAIKEKNYLLFENVIKILDHNNTKEIVETLKFAIEKGNLNITQYLINKLLLDLNYKIENNAFLNAALRRGQKHVGEFLIKLGFRPDTNDLLYASEKGYVKIVQTFLHDNKKKSHDYFAPLKLAVKNCHFKVAKLLVNLVRNQPNRIIALINITAQYGHLNLLRYFIKNNKLSNGDLTEAISIATQHGNLQIIQFLLKSSSIETSLNSIYLTASQYGHLDIITWLIDKNTDMYVIDTVGETALHLASQCGHYNVVQHLLQHKIDPNIQDNSGWSSLHWASNNKHTKIIKLLLKNNSSVLAQDKHGQTAFHLAAANGDMDILTVLLQIEIKLREITTNKGQTALHLAAQNGHNSIVEMLIRSDHVDINARNNNDETALIIASDNGHNDVVMTLLKHKAETLCKTKKEGYSPITIASSHGHIDILNSLIKFKANIETEEHSGWRAIHKAVQNGYVDIFNALLKQNVNINAKFEHGGTALHTVMRIGHVEIAKKLITHGADTNALFFSNMLPLRIAAHFGHTSIAELLLANGAEVNDVGNDKITPLHSACLNGHIEVVKLLIQHGANLHLKNNEEWTALHFAAKYGFIEIVKILLENSADIYAENNFNANGFHTACEAGHNNIVEMLLKKYKINVNVRGKNGVSGLHWASANNCNDVLNTLIIHRADVNLRADDGSTPLHWAVDHTGSVNIIKTLIKYDAIVNIQDFKGASPLHLASIKGKIEAVEELLKNHADINLESKNISPLHLAVAQGHYKIVEVLLKFKANVNSAGLNNKTSLNMALDQGYTDIARLLIENNANVNLRDIDGFNALHSAAQKGHTDIVEILIKLTSDINISTVIAKTALQLALEHRHEDAAKILVTNNADVNRTTADGNPYLHLACREGMSEIILALLKRGVDINKQCQFNKLTPLHIALYYEHKDIAKMLIDNCADINISSISGWTPLHVAATKKGFTDIALELISRNAHINAQNKKMETPLYLATLKGFYDFVEMLLKYNAKVDVKCLSNRMTALSIAAQEGHFEILELLLEHNADINSKDFQGLTPLHISALYGHKECVLILLDKKADINSMTPDGWTVLQMAAAEGFTDIVDILLANSNANVNHRNKYGARAIDLARKEGHAEVVKRLLKYTDEF